MKETRILACMMAVAIVGALTDCSAKAADNGAADTTEQAVSTEGLLLVPENDAQLHPAMAVSKPTVIDFNADWCGPCRMLAPAYDMAAASYAGKVDFYSVNVDRFPQTSNAFGVSAIPMVVMIMPDGATRSFVGLTAFLAGLDPNSNPSNAEITNAMYGNLSKIIDEMTANK